MGEKKITQEVICEICGIEVVQGCKFCAKCGSAANQLYSSARNEKENSPPSSTGDQVSQELMNEEQIQNKPPVIKKINNFVETKFTEIQSKWEIQKKKRQLSDYEKHEKFRKHILITCILVIVGFLMGLLFIPILNNIGWIPGLVLLMVIWGFLGSAVGIFAMVSSMYAMRYSSKTSEFAISLIGILAPICAFFALFFILEPYT